MRTEAQERYKRALDERQLDLTAAVEREDSDDDMFHCDQGPAAAPTKKRKENAQAAADVDAGSSSKSSRGAGISKFFRSQSSRPKTNSPGDMDEFVLNMLKSGLESSLFYSQSGFVNIPNEVPANLSRDGKSF